MPDSAKTLETLMHPVPARCRVLPEKGTISNMLTWPWESGLTVPCQSFSRSGLLRPSTDATPLDERAISTVHLLHHFTAPEDELLSVSLAMDGPDCLGLQGIERQLIVDKDGHHDICGIDQICL